MAKKKRKPSASANKKTRKTKTSTRGKKKSTKGKKTKSKKIISPRIAAILYWAIAVVLLCLNFIKGEYVWNIIRDGMFGVFGVCSLFLPVFFAYVGATIVKDKDVKKIKKRRIRIFLSLAILLFASSLFYIFSNYHVKSESFIKTIQELYKYSSAIDNVFLTKGGALSGILGYPLIKMLGSTPAAIVSIVTLIVLIMILTGISISDVGKAAKRPVDAMANQVMIAREKAEVRQKAREYENEFNRRNKKRKIENSIDIPIEDKKKPKLDKSKIDKTSGTEGKAVDASEKEDLLSLIKIANYDYDEETKDNKASVLAKSISEKKTKEQKSEGAKQPDPETVPIEFSEDNKDNKRYDKGIIKTDKKKSSYKYPPVTLLKHMDSLNNKSAVEELQNNAEKLISTLNSFGVKAKIKNIARGPSVTRYELQPAPGVKISRITNLADDIALNLAANGVRIEAPIPGKAAVGIEVPNKVVNTVSMRELIDSEKFKDGKSNLSCVLGKDISGNIVLTDLDKMPHLLIAGTTGSGKSVCVNSMLLSILFRSTPEEVKLLLIDPKMVEFSKYRGIPHLLVPVVSDAKKAAAALGWAVNEMLQRYKTFSEYECKNIKSYNKLIEKNLKYIEKHSTEEEEKCLEVNGVPVLKEKLPQIVIAIDELADLMMAAPNEVEESICRLAQMARAAGMHLVIATQRPSVNVITGVIKANIPSRISLKVSSNVDSRTILDVGGAEKLIGKGDMLYAPVGAPNALRVQGGYATDKEIEEVTDFIKKSYAAQYNDDVEEKIRKIAAEEIDAGKSVAFKDEEGNELDDRMDEAVKIVIEAGQASISMLQRRMSVGYARAGKMVDDMERMGIVGPHQGSKPRDLLITYQDWLERSNIIGMDEE